MELVNSTRMTAGYTIGMGPSGREHLVVVVKGTFAIPDDGGALALASDQVPLVESDTFTGEPGLSAVVYESDFCLRKPRCDVLVVGSAHAPRGKPATRVRVGLRIGSLRKEFDVVGDRVWRRGLFGLRPSRPRAFTVMPISYDRAYGGVDDSSPKKVASYLPNLVGVGFHPRRKRSAVRGLPVPNLEAPGRPVKRAKGKYPPLSFGPLPRNSPTRVAFAGTYDQAWLDETFPFLPRDFDERYFQAAPPDQQIDHPQGGEEVQLLNLTAAGRTRFRLPALKVPVEFTNVAYARTELEATLDTIVIEPDASRVLLSWRASQPLKRNVLEMVQVVVGRMNAGWYRARDLGKRYVTRPSQLEVAP